MDHEDLEFELEDCVAIIRWTELKSAYFIHCAAGEIIYCLAKIEEDGDIIAVLITGKGKSFCAGFDFDELQNPDHKQIEAVMESSQKFHAALTNFPKPMVAVVDGPYMAGGFAPDRHVRNPHSL